MIFVLGYVTKRKALYVGLCVLFVIKYEVVDLFRI